MARRLDASVSDLNFLPEVAGGRAVSKHLIVADDTLREGEQAGEVSFSADDKVRLAEKLSEIGVHHIQVGFVGKSAADREVIRRLKANGVKAELEGIVLVFEPGWREQVDIAADSGVDIFGVLYPASDLRLSIAQKVSREQMLDIAVESVSYAVGKGLRVRFSPTDTTRANLDFLKKLYPAVVQAGAKGVSISDTAGTLLPGAMGFLVRQVLSVVDVPLQVHCHNDFGLAVANTLAAVEAGASIVDTTINGLGERTGNAPLDEVVVALEFLYGVDTGIDTSRLAELSHLLEGITGVPLPKSKPIVGEYAFAHKLDAHVRGALAHPRLYEVIDPTWVGNTSAVILGKGSGPYAVKYRLKELGIDADDRQVAELVDAVNASAMAKRAALTGAEFQSLVAQVIPQTGQ